MRRCVLPGAGPAIADNQFEAVRLYVIRGRRLRVMLGDDLQRVFVHAMTEWARKPLASKPRLLAADAGAEYMLRGLRPPYALVETQTERIVTAFLDLLDREEAEADEELDTDEATRLATN